MATRAEFLDWQRSGGNGALQGTLLRSVSSGLRGGRLRQGSPATSRPSSDPGAGVAILAGGRFEAVGQRPAQFNPSSGLEARTVDASIRDPRQLGYRVRPDRRGPRAGMGNCRIRGSVSPGGLGPGACATDQLLVVPEPGHGVGPGGDCPVFRRRTLSYSLGSGVGSAGGRGRRRPRPTDQARRLARTRLATRIAGLPAVLLSWRLQVDPFPTRWGSQLIQMALAELRADQIDSAIDALDLARISSPAMARRVRQMSTGGQFRDHLVEAIYRELSKSSNLPAGTRANIHRGRLLRQLPERSAQARSILESSLRSIPSDATANREWGALLLSWPEQPLDHNRTWKPWNRHPEATNLMTAPRASWR